MVILSDPKQDWTSCEARRRLLHLIMTCDNTLRKSSCISKFATLQEQYSTVGRHISGRRLRDLEKRQSEILF